MKQSANLLIQLRPADKTLQAAVDRLGGRLLDCESLWESASEWCIELVSKWALDCINHHTMFCPVAPSPCITVPLRKRAIPSPGRLLIDV